MVLCFFCLSINPFSVGPYIILCQMFVKSDFALDSALVFSHRILNSLYFNCPKLRYIVFDNSNSLFDYSNASILYLA